MTRASRLSAEPLVLTLLAPLPLGFLVTAGFLDLMYLGLRLPALAQASFMCIVVGVALACAEAALRIVWKRSPADDAQSIAESLLVVALFAASAWLRRAELNHTPTAAALTLELGALSVGTLVSCAGSELRSWLRLDAARMDSPSPLSAQHYVQARYNVGQNAPRGHNATGKKLDFPIVRVA
jgi:uncharacterized membrane protein